MIGDIDRFLFNESKEINDYLRLKKNKIASFFDAIVFNHVSSENYKGVRRIQIDKNIPFIADFHKKFIENEFLILSIIRYHKYMKK